METHTVVVLKHVDPFNHESNRIDSNIKYIGNPYDHTTQQQRVQNHNIQHALDIILRRERWVVLY
jgi:hypothetical protein